MSYSDERKKYTVLGESSGILKFELAFLKQKSTVSINEDHAVELLVDELRRVLSKFHFKEPLGDEFDVAKEAALSCLDMRNPLPRQVRYWIDDCLKCIDCILLVYMRDILKQSVPIPKGEKWAKERDVYNAYQSSAEDDLKKIGTICNQVYKIRSDLSHYQVVTVDGKRMIRSKSGKLLLKIFRFTRDRIKEPLDLVVPRYRKAFPQHCIERS